MAIVLGAVSTIVVAIVTGVTTLRSNTRATALQQQQALEARSDKQYDRLVTQLDEAERDRDAARAEAAAYRRERDQAQDDYARLRHRVWLAGHDPDLIGREPDAHSPPPQ